MSKINVHGIEKIVPGNREVIGKAIEVINRELLVHTTITVDVYFSNEVADHTGELSIQTHKGAYTKLNLSKTPPNITIRISTKDQSCVLLQLLRESGRAIFAYCNFPASYYGAKISETTRLAYNILAEAYGAYYAFSKVSVDNIRHQREISRIAIERGAMGYIVQGNSSERRVTTPNDRLKTTLIAICNFVAAAYRLGEPLEVKCEEYGEIGKRLYRVLRAVSMHLDENRQRGFILSYEVISETKSDCESIVALVDRIAARNKHLIIS